jgi:hypothetical protein
MPLDKKLSLREQNIPSDASLLLKSPDEPLSNNGKFLFFLFWSFGWKLIESCLGKTDPNIWEEPTNEDTIIIDEKGNIDSATLNKLVEYLTSTESLSSFFFFFFFLFCFLTNSIKTDAQFQDLFLMMYKSFTSPQRLFRKLLERYNVPAHVEVPKGMAIKMRVCVFLKYWAENKYHEMTPELKDQIHLFLDTTLQHDFPTFVPGLKKALANPPPANVLQFSLHLLIILMLK